MSRWQQLGDKFARTARLLRDDCDRVARECEDGVELDVLYTCYQVVSQFMTEVQFRLADEVQEMLVEQEKRGP